VRKVDAEARPKSMYLKKKRTLRFATTLTHSQPFRARVASVTASRRPTK
jgi:hypothetical protein